MGPRPHLRQRCSSEDVVDAMVSITLGTSMSVQTWIALPEPQTKPPSSSIWAHIVSVLNISGCMMYAAAMGSCQCTLPANGGVKSTTSTLSAYATFHEAVARQWEI